MAFDIMTRLHGWLDTYRLAQRAPMTKHDWTDKAVACIHEWFEASDSVALARIRGGDPERMIENCVAAYASTRSFQVVDRLVLKILSLLEVGNLHDTTGMFLGCDWGFSTLHLAQAWSPQFILGLDVNGKFGTYGQRLIKETPEKFSNVAIRNTPLPPRKQQFESFDFIIASSSYTLFDMEDSRLELIQVLCALKTGGAFLYHLPSQSNGYLPQKDLPGLLSACGLDLLDSGSPNLLMGVKKRSISPDSTQQILESCGQDQASILQKTPSTSSVHTSPEEHAQQIRKHLEQGDATLDTLPLNYMLKVTSRCNIRCIFCDYSDIKRHYSMPETLLAQIHAALPITKTISLSGGEPLLSSVTKHFLEVSHNYPNLELQMASNMSLANKHVDDIVSNVTRLSCSLDAATPETYAALRQQSDWKAVTSNLKRIKELKEETHQSTPLISLSFIIMGQNLHELADFVDLCAKLGAEGIKFGWLCWTLTPRIDRKAKIDLNDDVSARALCEQLVEASSRAKRLSRKILWGSGPHRIQTERPDLFAEYCLDRHCPSDEKTIYPSESMPDGLMPCIDPFTWYRVTTPTTACFCSAARPEFSYIPMVPSLPLSENWNHPLLVQARNHFIAGEYEQVCRPECPKFRTYLKNKTKRNQPI